ncbi:MAG: ATP-binding protein [Symploca sp. SIO2G7]|nr:ATP-binding protein [Symploca sp. SIO2G7]
MGIDLQQFYQVTDPSKTLNYSQSEDNDYYIDFSNVRGGEIIRKLRNKIAILAPDRPTCTLFTGHIGCGKSTELLRLKTELEQNGFHVVYFVSSKDLELTDVDIGDLLLAIAQRISQSLDSIQVKEPKNLKDILVAAAKLLSTEIELTAEGQFMGVSAFYDDTKGGANFGVPGVGEINIGRKGFSLVAAGIGKITARAKNDARLRDKLNQFLAPQKTQLLDAINDELVEPAIEALKSTGKRGLVVIIDNLDRISNTPKYGSRPQQEYLFIDQGEFLSNLHCHIVYTMPLSLKFCNEYNILTQRFEPPSVLPMVTVQYSDGQACEEGLRLLEQMVLARAYPHLDEVERLRQSAELFDDSASLRRLCQVSGGHVRDLLRLLNSWIQEDMALPLQRDSLETVIRSFRNEMIMQISDSEWPLLRQVQERKEVRGDQEYQTLIRSRLVFEYRFKEKCWFDINPILKEARELET